MQNKEQQELNSNKYWTDKNLSALINNDLKFYKFSNILLL